LVRPSPLNFQVTPHFFCLHEATAVSLLFHLQSLKLPIFVDVRGTPGTRGTLFEGATFLGIVFSISIGLRTVGLELGYTA
jgi:hypothetical protein